MKKGLMIVGALALLLGLSSCSTSYEIKDYNNKVSYKEFLKWEDKFEQIINGKDYICEEKYETNYSYKVLRDEECIETYKSVNNQNTIAKIDYDTKLVNEVYKMKGESHLKGIHGKEDSKANGDHDYLYQTINGHYYQLDNDKKGKLSFYTFESLASKYIAVVNLIDFKHCEEFYIDGNIYTAIDLKNDNEDQVKVQITLNDNLITFVISSEENKETKTNDDYLKQESHLNKYQITYKINDVSLKEIDTKEYELK